jgi:hypothetical protein
MSLIALEEHYACDPASSDNVVATWLRSKNHVAYERLYDRGPLRIEQMDAARIDFQILSLFDPGVQDVPDVAQAVISSGVPTTTWPKRCAPSRIGSAASPRWRRRTPTPRQPNCSLR